MTMRTKTVRGLIVWAALVLLCATLGFSGKEDAAATKSTAQGSAAVAAPAKPEAVPATEPAKELTLNLGGGATMKMALIRPGKFMMGEEKDQHEVTISKPLYMGVTEVTQAQYEAVMGTNPSNFKGATNPVESVSWNDAADFCRKLSEKTGKTVRLPTEAEWEYACRAGTATAFSFGDSDSALGDYAWYSANSGNTTHPVGQKKPNAWGLYDMHGNAWEWCADWYGDYPKGAATDPQGPASGTYRVLRGGCWNIIPAFCRAAIRTNGYTPVYRDDSFGFRVVVSVSTAQGSAAVAAPAKPEAVPATEPAKELTLNLGGGVTMKMVFIPAGKFLMGSPDEEKKAAVKEAVAAGIPEALASDAFKDEVQHEVTISKPFYMGITHVTVDQFAAFVKDSGYKTDAEKDGWSIGFEIKDGKIDFKVMDGGSWRNPSFDQKGDHPVVQVSWNDAKAFCDWLSKKSGKTVVLPTEAQWEYACRAGTKTAYPWGDNPDDGKGWANAADQSLKKKLPNAPAEWKFFSWDDGFVFTAPVGSFKANAFGLYDMNGNAWQWCQDRYGDYEKGAVTDPTGADAGGLRVLRGGSWSSNPGNCRSEDRVRGNPGSRSDGGGFRVAVAAGVDLPYPFALCPLTLYPSWGTGAKPLFAAKIAASAIVWSRGSGLFGLRVLRGGSWREFWGRNTYFPKGLVVTEYCFTRSPRSSFKTP